MQKEMPDRYLWLRVVRIAYLAQRCARPQHRSSQHCETRLGRCVEEIELGWMEEAEEVFWYASFKYDVDSRLCKKLD